MIFRNLCCLSHLFCDMRNGLVLKTEWPSQLASCAVEDGETQVSFHFVLITGFWYQGQCCNILVFATAAAEFLEVF